MLAVDDTRLELCNAPPGLLVLCISHWELTQVCEPCNKFTVNMYFKNSWQLSSGQCYHRYD